MCVGNRLADRLCEWINKSAQDHVTKWIKNSIDIQFISEPCEFTLQNGNLNNAILLIVKLIDYYQIILLKSVKGSLRV